MQNLPIPQSDDLPLPKGIDRRRALPDPELGALWDSIIVDARIKRQLLAQAVLNFTVRAKVPHSVLPLHGVILVGPPGTGKTSLARGLGHRTAESFTGTPFQWLEVEPHKLTSSALGKTQRAVSDLFAQSIIESASAGPSIVLLDEVETLAANRSKMSFEANPVDVHRATNAVLVQLDALAERQPQLLFVATSNFPEAVDPAFTSRCDLMLDIPLPDQNACNRILNNCLKGLGDTYPAIRKLAASPELNRCAEACTGLDGRAIRKMVANALASTPQIAINPDQLTIDHLLEAVRSAKTHRTATDESS